MKQYLHGFAMCQSMFCAIPCPWSVWDQEARDKMMLFLPAVGLEIGALWALLAWGCRLLNLPELVRGGILCAWPYLATGFLHLDGFMDVTDAVKSCRDLQRRREILKDSHVGSFAVIGCVLLMLAQFAMAASLPESGSGIVLLLLPALSRCCAALAVVVLRPMATSQYAAQKKPRSHALFLAGLLCVILAAGFLLSRRAGIGLVGGMVGYGLALHRGYRSLDGMNGDIAGYALTLGELCGIAVYALI